MDFPSLSDSLAMLTVHWNYSLLFPSLHTLPAHLCMRQKVRGDGSVFVYIYREREREQSPLEDTVTSIGVN